MAITVKSDLGYEFDVKAKAAEVLRYLDDRELPDGSETVYHRRSLPVRLLDRPGSVVPAVTYVANRDCRHYCAPLTDEAAAAVIGGVASTPMLSAVTT